MHYTREEIGAILKKLRIETGMTQRTVAELLGRRQQIIGHWETGYAQPDLDTFFQLCALYQADISTVFGVEKDTPNVSRDEVELINAYRIATTEEQALIDMILKKYKGGSAIALLNDLYTSHIDRWLPPKE